MQYRGVFVCVVLWSCGGGKKQGELGADCYPNGTCNVTLACVGGLCVASSSDGGPDGLVDAHPDAPIDARPDAPIDSHPDAPPDAPPDANCEAIQAMNLSDGHHDAGQSCLQAGCHLIGNTGAGAPEYSYGGTLYHDSGGVSAFPGATVIVTLGSSTFKAVAQQNGNFYIPKALFNPPTAGMPASVVVSGCPDNVVMVGALVDNGGNCNNCHRTGGTTNQIHLP